MGVSRKHDDTCTHKNQYTNACIRGYWEPSKISKKEVFAKIADGWIPLTIFVKSLILDISQGFGYASAYYGSNVLSYSLTLYMVVCNGANFLWK